VVFTFLRDIDAVSRDGAIPFKSMRAYSPSLKFPSVGKCSIGRTFFTGLELLLRIFEKSLGLNDPSLFGWTEGSVCKY